jgi:hypothetical protein
VNALGSLLTTAMANIAMKVVARATVSATAVVDALATGAVVNGLAALRPSFGDPILKSDRVKSPILVTATGAALVSQLGLVGGRTFAGCGA